MKSKELKCRAVSRPWRSGVEFQVQLGSATAEPLLMVERDEMETTSATFELSMTASQILMDDLWSCGVRPTEGIPGAGELAALKDHIEDLRHLVFKKETPITEEELLERELEAEGKMVVKPGQWFNHPCE